MKLLDLVGNRILLDEGLNASFPLVRHFVVKFGIQLDVRSVAGFHHVYGHAFGAAVQAIQACLQVVGLNQAQLDKSVGDRHWVVGDITGLQNNEIGVAFTQWHDLEPFLEMLQARIYDVCFAARTWSRQVGKDDGWIWKNRNGFKADLDHNLGQGWIVMMMKQATMNDCLERITIEQVQNSKKAFAALLEKLLVMFMQKQHRRQAGGIGVDVARQAVETKVGNEHLPLPEIPLT